MLKTFETSSSGGAGQTKIQLQNQSVNTGAAGVATTYNFTGAGVTEAVVGSVSTITIPGGGATPPTLDPNIKSNVTLSGANLIATTTGGALGDICSQGLAAQPLCVEITFTTAPNNVTAFGFQSQVAGLNNFGSGNGNYIEVIGTNWYGINLDGGKYGAYSAQASIGAMAGTALANGDVVTMEVNPVSRALVYKLNGSVIPTPYTTIPGNDALAASYTTYSSATAVSTYNFGATAYAHADAGYGAAGLFQLQPLFPNNTFPVPTFASGTYVPPYGTTLIYLNNTNAAEIYTNGLTGPSPGADPVGAVTPIVVISNATGGTGFTNHFANYTNFNDSGFQVFGLPYNLAKGQTMTFEWDTHLEQFNVTACGCSNDYNRQVNIASGGASYQNTTSRPMQVFWPAEATITAVEFWRQQYPSGHSVSAQGAQILGGSMWLNPNDSINIGHANGGGILLDTFEM